MEAFWRLGPASGGSSCIRGMRFSVLHDLNRDSASECGHEAAGAAQRPRARDAFPVSRCSVARSFLAEFIWKDGGFLVPWAGERRLLRCAAGSSPYSTI